MDRALAKFVQEIGINPEAEADLDRIRANRFIKVTKFNQREATLTALALGVKTPDELTRDRVDIPVDVKGKSQVEICAQLGFTAKMSQLIIDSALYESPESIKRLRQLAHEGGHDSTIALLDAHMASHAVQRAANQAMASIQRARSRT